MFSLKTGNKSRCLLISSQNFCFLVLTTSFSYYFRFVMDEFARPKPLMRGIGFKTPDSCWLRSSRAMSRKSGIVMVDPSGFSKTEYGLDLKVFLCRVLRLVDLLREGE